MVKFRSLFRSFSHALRGIKTLAKTEQSFRLQLLAGVLVVFFAVFFPITAFEKIIVFLLVALVLILEMINSIFERIVDAFKPRLNPIVGEIKDIMAAAVLVASIFSAIIGLIIFFPHIIRLFAA
ncbi:MAG: diacylglycerol kinase family protein [Patescibacteria group bacterium]|jgi:diacylglycerol kinase